MLDEAAGDIVVCSYYMHGFFIEEFAQHEGDIEAAIDAGFGDVLWGILAEGTTLGPIYIQLKTRSEGGRVKEGRKTWALHFIDKSRIDTDESRRSNTTFVKFFYFFAHHFPIYVYARGRGGMERGKLVDNVHVAFEIEVH